MISPFALALITAEAHRLLWLSCGSAGVHACYLVDMLSCVADLLTFSSLYSIKDSEFRRNGTATIEILSNDRTLPS